MNRKKGIGSFETPIPFNVFYILILHFFLDFVGQVAEEVNARLLFEMVNIDDVISQIITSFVLCGMFNPERHSLIAVVRLVAQHRHEEVFGNNQTAACLLDDLIAVINGAAFADIERLTE